MCFNCMSSRNVLLFLGPFPSHAGWSLSPPATEAPWASCHFPWPAQERGVSPLSPSLLRLHSGGPSLRRREGRPPFQGERLSARGLGSSAPVPGARNSSSCYVVPSRSSGPRGDCCPPGGLLRIYAGPQRWSSLGTWGKPGFCQKPARDKQALLSTPGPCSPPSTKESGGPAGLPALVGPRSQRAGGLQRAGVPSSLSLSLLLHYLLLCDQFPQNPVHKATPTFLG